jgi:Leucine-rich repeat (LRR) protein
MEKLPNEILEKIFEDIDETEKKPVREVCTKWYDMNPMETMVIKYKNDDQERVINDILKIKPKELVFSYCHDVPGRFSIKAIIDAVINQVDIYILKIEHCYFSNTQDEYIFKFDKLEYFIVNESYIPKITIKSDYLDYLKITNCGVKDINLDECPSLTFIILYYNALEEFAYFSDELVHLDLSCNNLYEVELDCNNVKHLTLDYNKHLQLFNMEGGSELLYLELLGCEQITHNIDYNEYINLKTLDVSETSISELDISELNNLESLDIGFTRNLTEIDLSNNTKLTKLVLYQSSLNELDLSNNKNLKQIEAGNTPQLIIDTSHLTLEAYTK